MALEVARLCVQEDEKIAETIKVFWHLWEAACERMRVLPFWANAKASLTYAKELFSSKKPLECKL